jgi:hypothetical protein
MASNNWTIQDLQRKGLVKKAAGLPERPAENTLLVPTGIYIPGDVISSKNSKDARYVNGKPQVVSSQQAIKYKASTTEEYLKNGPLFRQMIKDVPRPFYCVLKFLRKTKGRFDANNMTQMVADMMVHTGWIEDDDDRIIRFIALNTQYSHKQPGVVIFA